MIATTIRFGMQSGLRLELFLAFLPEAPVRLRRISWNCPGPGSRAVSHIHLRAARTCFMATRHQPPASSRNSSSAPEAKSPSQELLYDPAIPSLSHAERARTMSATAADATLCTLSSDGFPYGSVVLHAVHESGDPVLLISEMAEHTKNLHNDNRCSLLVREAGSSNVLARGRVTFVGIARRVDKQTDIGDAFLKKNPAARQYADFGDFSFWRIEVSALRYIGGFGRMSWLDLESWREAREDAVAVSATQNLISALNEPAKAEKLAVVAKTFSRASTVASVSVTAVDQYGFEVDAETEHGIRPIRVAFKRTAKDADDVSTLVEELEKLANV